MMIHLLFCMRRMTSEYSKLVGSEDVRGVWCGGACKKQLERPQNRRLRIYIQWNTTHLPLSRWQFEIPPVANGPQDSPFLSYQDLTTYVGDGWHAVLLNWLEVGYVSSHNRSPKLDIVVSPSDYLSSWAVCFRRAYGRILY